MQPLNLSGVKYAVVVAPHSDDETIGAFHTIAELRKRNARVDIVVVTDGAASHRNSASWPREKLVAARKRETGLAMHRAGVPKQHIEFLDLPDGGLAGLSRRDRYRAIVALRRRAIPHLVIGPSALDDHPDHRAVAHLCRRAWGPAIPSLTYLVWPVSGQTQCSGDIYVDGDIDAKRQALDCYRTQLGAIEDDPHGFELTAEMQERMCTAREWYSC